MSSGTRCLEAALLYASRGWQVFPVGSGKSKKEPFTKNGLHDATTDPAVIRAWWKKWPAANVGIRTGAASRLAVLDLDAKDIPLEVLMAECERLAGSMFPRTAMSKTGGGGMHLLFELQEGQTVQNTTGSICKNVDTRGEGGYIVAPPSLHWTGNLYQWVEEDGETGLESEVAPVSADWLVRLMKSTGTTAREERVRNGDLGDVSWVPSALFSLSASMPYADWFRIGMSLRDVPGGYEMWMDWSATSPKFDQESAELQWQRIQNNGKSFIGLGTLWHAATQAGWKPSKVKKQEPVVPDWMLEDVPFENEAPKAKGKKQEAPAEEPAAARTFAPNLPEDYDIDEAGRLVRITVVKGRDGKEAEKHVLVSDPPFFITKRIYEVTMGVESLQAEWEDEGRAKVQVESRRVFCSSNALLGCLDAGIPVTSATSAEAVRYIGASEALLRRRVKQERMSRVLGWHGRGFLLGEEQMGDAPAFLKLDETGAKAVAMVHQKGTAREWAEALLPALLAHDNLRVMVAAAMASPLLPFLGETARPFVMDLAGETGCGKSQMMQIALSAIGYPLELATTFSSTPIAIQSYVSMFAHHTVGIDETKNWPDRLGPKGLSALVYQLMSGRGRDRGTTVVGKFQRTEEFKSVIITTSEYPLSSVTGDGGLRSRCVTLHGLPWGVQSPEMAATIADLLSKVSMNYGHAQRRMVEHLQGLNDAGKKDMRDRWNALQKQYTQRALTLSPGNKVAPRLAGYMATLELSWNLLQSFVEEWVPASQLPIEWQELQAGTNEVWQKVLSAGASADRPLAALEFVLGLVAQQPDGFAAVGAKTAAQPNGGWLGVARMQDGVVVELGLVVSRLKEVMKRADFDAEGVFKAWQLRGWLETDAKRLDKKVLVAGVRTRCIVFSKAGLAASSGEQIPDIRVVDDGFEDVV